MKVHLIEDSNKLKLYTYRLLHLQLEANNIPLVDADEADLFLVSVDDPDDWKLIKRARKIAGDRPLIAGGFEGFGGEYVLAYADAINVGEGFEFFEVLGNAKDVNDLYDLPYILTKTKEKVIPSTYIDNSRLPLVRVRPKVWYYLAGRGCKGKCAFCETGFAYPHWSNNEFSIKQAVRTVEGRGHKLTLITNYSEEAKGITKARSVQSVRVVDYLKAPGRFKTASMLHFGIEGFSEEQRKAYGKPIPDRMIYELIDVIGEQRQQAEFFFVIGLPGTFEAMMEFANSVPISAEPYPKIMVKLTRLDPSPHTPLWTFDLRQLERIGQDGFDEFHNTLKARNIRFRLFPMRSDARQTYKAVLRRCSSEDALRIGTEPKPKSSDDVFMDQLDKAGLGHLLTYDGRPMPNSQIVTPYRDLRDKMADKLGMMPVNYKASAS